MGVGQPGMQREQADLGAVTQQQEHEGEIEHAPDANEAAWATRSVHTMALGPAPMAGSAAM